MNCACAEKITVNTVFKYDPTRTSVIRNRWIKDFTRRFIALNKVVDKAILEDDILQIDSGFGSIQRLKLNTPSDRLKSFQLWLSDQHDNYLLSEGKEGIKTIRRPGTIRGIETEWTDVYIESGYQKGVLRARQELKKIGLDAQATELNLSGFSASFNQPFHIDRLGLLFTQGFDLVKNVSNDLQSKLTRTVALGMAEGRSPRDIVNMFGEGTLKGLHKDASKALIRAKAIARTEVIRAHHTANMAEYERMGIEGVEVLAEWSTAGFNVCFPAWTYVNTSEGIKPIQKLKIGELVHTRQGLKKILITSEREYKGNMIKLETNIGNTFVTEEHPYWDITKGWIEAKELSKDNVLQSIYNKRVNIIRVINFCFGYSTNNKSIFNKISIFFRIFNRIMPIRPINFQSNVVFRNIKVNKIRFSFKSFYRKFLNIFNFQFIKSFSDYFFKIGFSRKLSITSKRTENIITRRNYSKFFNAVFTSFYMWWSSTFFRAVMSFKTSSNICIRIFKRLFASFTFDNNKTIIFSRGSFYFAIIAIFTGTTVLYFKEFFTSGTLSFTYSDFFFVSFVALCGTESCVGIGSFSFTTWVKIFFAILANFIRKCLCGIMITSRGTKSLFAFFVNVLFFSNKRFFTMITYKIKRHYYNLRCSLNVFYSQLYHIQTNVYNLKIEDVSEFYANDILVHNCPLCSPLEGKIFSLGAMKGMIPRHPSCRCVAIPRLKEDIGDKDEIRGKGKEGETLMGSSLSMSPCIVSTRMNLLVINIPRECTDFVFSGGEWKQQGRVLNNDEIERIKKLKIPPAWRNVVVSSDPNAKVLVIGQDSAGRWQYRYSQSFISEQAQQKFNRSKMFVKDIKTIRTNYENGIEKGRQEAYLLRLEDKTAIRAGSDVDFKAKKKAYGLTTLQKEHVQIENNKIIFEFVAKEGISQKYILEDSTLASWLKSRSEKIEIGDKLFPDITAKKLNNYIKEISGKEYTIKDFRTYHGTRIAQNELEKYLGKSYTKKEKNKITKDVSTKVSEFLHNTPTMARQSYIDPMVWEMIGGT